MQEVAERVQGCHLKTFFTDKKISNAERHTNTQSNKQRHLKHTLLSFQGIVSRSHSLPSVMVWARITVKRKDAVGGEWFSGEDKFIDISRANFKGFSWPLVSVTFRWWWLNLPTGFFPSPWDLINVRLLCGSLSSFLEQGVFDIQLTSRKPVGQCHMVYYRKKSLRYSAHHSAVTNSGFAERKWDDIPEDQLRPIKNSPKACVNVKGGNFNTLCEEMLRWPYSCRYINCCENSLFLIRLTIKSLGPKAFADLSKSEFDHSR